MSWCNVPSARRLTRQKDWLVFCWASGLNWSCCGLVSAAEGAKGAGGVDVGEGVVVGEGSAQLPLGVARHGGCAAAKVHGGALILVFCKAMACSVITYWLQERNIATSLSFIFPVDHWSSVGMTATQVYSGHKEEILEQCNQLGLMKVLCKPRSCKKLRMCGPVTLVGIGILLEYSGKG